MISVGILAAHTTPANWQMDLASLFLLLCVFFFALFTATTGYLSASGNCILDGNVSPARRTKIRIGGLRAGYTARWFGPVCCKIFAICSNDCFVWRCLLCLSYVRTYPGRLPISLAPARWMDRLVKAIRQQRHILTAPSASSFNRAVVRTFHVNWCALLCMCTTMWRRF